MKVKGFVLHFFHTSYFTLHTSSLVTVLGGVTMLRSSDWPVATRHSPRSLWPCLVIAVVVASPARAQTLPTPTPDYSRRPALSSDVSSEAAGPQGLRDYVVNGKLRLALADAIRLTLLNNTDIQI